MPKKSKYATPEEAYQAKLKHNRESHKRRYAANPVKFRRKRTHFHRYGITVEDYDRMYAEQNGRCAICGLHQSQQQRRLHVDHDHETGEVRGLLCMNCNSLLGHACDEVPTLLGAIQYLQRS